MSDGSQVPAFALAGTLVGAVVMLAVAVWLVLRTRRGGDTVLWALTSVIAGVGVALGSLFVAGMRHYGGSTVVDGQKQANCGSWWSEAGLASDRRADVGDLSSTCRHDAIAAIGPALLWAVVIGLAVGVVLFALLWALGRRSARRGARPRPPSVVVESG